MKNQIPKNLRADLFGSDEEKLLEAFRKLKDSGLDVNDIVDMIRADEEDDCKEEIKVSEKHRRKFFLRKNELLSEIGSEVNLESLIRDIFPDLQDSNLVRGETDGKGCVLITTRRKRIEKNGKERKYEERRVIKSDYKGIDTVLENSNSTSLLFPFTVYGNRHRKQNAHQLFAMTIDIDYVWGWHMENLIHQFKSGHLLPPTYITNSGNGVHLWYVLKKPLRMTPEQGQHLVMFKKMLMHKIWNGYTSASGNDRDSANIYQGFRLPGVYTKLAFDRKGKLRKDAEEYRTKVFKIDSGAKYDVAELRSTIVPERGFHEDLWLRESERNFIPNWELIESDEPWQHIHQPKHTKEEARELFPEWAERVLDGVPKQTKENSGWTCKRALYDWWKRKIQQEAVVGGRYWAIRALVQYGYKCGISQSEITTDAKSFMGHLNEIAKEYPFTEEDMMNALMTAFQDITKKKMSTRAFISESSKIPIVPKIQRNGLKQKQHLELARYKRDMLMGDKDAWRNKDGRPDKRAIVVEWQQANPSGTKYRCIKDTGLSKATVYKWWGV